MSLPLPYEIINRTNVMSGRSSDVAVYTSDQMRAYAAAAVEAEREQCALACVEAGELASQMYGDGAKCIATADLCADAIRARSKA